MASHTPIDTINISGKHCASCNAPQKGNWKHDELNDDWNFIAIPIEHHVNCADLNAPLLDHISWDDQALFGDQQPTIPRPSGPTRNGSRLCEYGSIASGGNNIYCTCDRCF